LRHQGFVRQAVGQRLGQQEVERQEGALRASLLAVWKMPWESSHKEVLWRLAVNGVAGAGGHDIRLRGRCPCGFLPADGADASVHRLHAFWECPVARAVRLQLQQGLGGVSPQRRHVWLLESPSRGCQLLVWRVVGLAALNAMEYGRSRLWVQSLQVGDPGERLAEVARAASVFFWSELQDFTLDRLGLPGAAWAGVGRGHPFLQTGLPGCGGVSLHVPDGLALA
jgi:hypothetical protein